MRTWYLIFTLAFLMLLRCGNPTVADGGGGIETVGVYAQVRYPDGDTVDSATVTVVAQDYLADVSMHAPAPMLRRIDTGGIVRVDSLDTGSYSIEINDGHGFAVLLQCRATGDTSVMDLGTLTLQPTSAITGQIEITQPDSWYGATVYAYGTDRIAATDSLGNFVLADMPAGVYDLKIVPNSRYVTALDYGNVRVESNLPKRLGRIVLAVHGCPDFSCDSQIVRLVLDENGLDSVAVTAVTGIDSALDRVVSLDLSNKEIATISELLQNLSQLRELYLAGNALNRLPGDLSMLSSLRILDLSDNQFDTLPTSLCALESLHVLSLHGNRIETLPADIKNLTGLQELYLSKNYLRFIPAELCSLTALTSLHLGSNSLSWLPQEFGKLHSLVGLHLENNGLSALPEGLWQIPGLQVIDLSNNRLVSLASSVGNMTTLTRLNISGNLLRSLPEGLMDVDGLESLEMANNLLCDLPESIALWADSLTPGWQETQTCGQVR